MITSWNEMPIGVLQQVDDINGLHISDEEKTFRATALLAGMDYDEFMNLPLVDSTAMISKTAFVREMPKKVRVRSEYQIGSRRYVLHRNMMDITVAQYINYQAIFDKKREDYLPELLAIVLIPKGHKYGEGYDMEEVVEEIRSNLNVEEGLSIADFFITKSSRLMRRICRRLMAAMTVARIRSKKEEKEMMRAMELEMRLSNDALLSEYGYNWRKRWPK